MVKSALSALKSERNSIGQYDLCKDSAAVFNVQCTVNYVLAMCNVQCSMQCQLCSAQLLLSVTKSLVPIKETGCPSSLPSPTILPWKDPKKQTNLGFSPKEPAEKKLKGGEPHYIIS